MRQRRSVWPSETISATSSLKTAGDHPVEEHGRLVGVLGEIDVTEVLLGEPRPEDLVVRVAEAQSRAPCGRPRGGSAAPPR